MNTLLKLIGQLIGVSDRRTPLPCSRTDCSVGVHYHWGWGNRHSSTKPVTGSGSFSDGQPFIKK